VKIKDIVQESAYDWFTNRKAAELNAQSQTTDRELTIAATGLLKKAVAFFQGGGPALTPQDQQMIAQIDQDRKTNNLPAINWKTGKVVEPTGPSQMVQQYKLYSRDPLIYNFKSIYFTVNNQDQWVFYNPTTKTVQAGVDAVTAKLLTQATARDGIELGLNAPQKHNAPVVQPTTPPAQVFRTNPARTGAQ
jgi:hypothetical protein